MERISKALCHKQEEQTLANLMARLLTEEEAKKQDKSDEVNDNFKKLTNFQ